MPNVSFPVLIFWQAKDGSLKTEWIKDVSINAGIADQVLRLLPVVLNKFNISMDPDAKFNAFWLDSDSWITEMAETANPDWAGRPLVAVERRISGSGVDFFKSLISTVPAYKEALAAASTRAARRTRESVAPRSYDVFISHASEDKDAIARPLYAALVQGGITVWFDEATLELGDSLRRKIDEGLARCRFGIVILSPCFLAKEWPQRELDGLVARETASGEKAILPIWHKLDRSTVMKYSPPLGDRLAARSDEGVARLVEKIVRVLRKLR
jgi:hypothetical protein